MLFIYLVAYIAFVCSPLAAAPSQPLVGAYYFAGWWRPLPNKYHIEGKDWRPDFPERVSLLGDYNEQATMDKEIAAAASHGVNFFQILWYYQNPNRPLERHAEMLNEGLRLFMLSKNNRQMQFAMEITNHPPFEIENDTEWERLCSYFCKVMKHPSYMKVDGRPVITILSVDMFYKQSGSNFKRMAARLTKLRKMAIKSGAGDPLFGGGVGAGRMAEGEIIEPYDFLTTYMEMPNFPKQQASYSYEHLIKYAEDSWKRYEKCGRPYVPYIPSGWDPRPWKDPRCSFDLPNQAEWTNALQRARKSLELSHNLGIPKADGSVQRAVLVYAWNEFGEGGIIAPTKGDKLMKLEAIQRVFGK